ncbi:MAG: FixH family protein, partial [Syntrophales bacterium]|nr:FixH family protein [Syntrophales bacterium]
TKGEQNMKKLVLAMMVVFMMTGLAVAKDFELTKKAGDFTVTVKIDRNPPVTGENNIAVAIKDAGGADVKDAKVSVEYSMPAMPGMPPMQYKADAKLAGSEYQAKLNYSMSGAWDTIVRISRGNKKTQAKFNIDVR